MTESALTPDLAYCAECSRMVGEQLYGTAPRTDVWILLEYVGPWNAKALAQSDLPDAIKAHIDGWLNRLPNPKFQFIKQSDGVGANGYTLFVALSRELRPLLFEFQLDDYADLLKLDLPALVENPGAYQPYQRKSPIYTVCTNGRRDISCARYGQPIYSALSKVAGVNAWQTTHMGGHRFAATMACLPFGVVYGHVDADEVGDLITGYRAGKVSLDRLRGRSCYDGPVQAADYYLRGILGIDALLGVELVSIEPLPDTGWTVRFHTPHDGQRYSIRLESRLSEWKVYESSGDAEPKAMPQFHLIDHDVERA